MKSMLRCCVFCIAFGLASASAKPLFENSVVSNDIEFLTTSDPSAFYCLLYFGTEDREMPDKRSDALMADGVHVFEAWFTDGTAVPIWAHPDLGDQSAAEATARLATGPLGRLPSFMRERLDHVVIHSGDETAFAEDQGRFFVLYDANMRRRIKTHDLEETVFHEAVHATLDVPIAASDGWQAAQRADGQALTHYAADNPGREDLAESALFAFTYFQHPERLGPELRANIEVTIPARLAFLRDIFGPDQQMQKTVGPLQDCPS